LVAITLAGTHAGTIHVAPGGDDASAGTLESPFRTLQKAAEVARAGDTVLVRSGVYRGQVLLRHSGEPDNSVILRNAPGEKPVVAGDADRVRALGPFEVRPAIHTR
jgi:hypothetical protein